MKITGSSKIHSLILGAALGSGLCFVSPAFAGGSYIVDSNGKGLTDLGTLGGSSSAAGGINNAGQVVGDSTTAMGDTHAFITGPNGVGMTDLGTLGGFNFSTARGINDAGQVAGYSSSGFASSDGRAFITGYDGVGMTDLGTLGTTDSGNNSSSAFGINNAGQVVGFSTRWPFVDAFVTGPNGVGMIGLGTVRGSANGINDAGQVVGGTGLVRWNGNVPMYIPGYHAFITGANGMGMIDLGTLGGGYSTATGINDAGQVVGYSETATGAQHAFITGPNGVGMTDLNLLVSLPYGVVLNEAMGINNLGQIAVNGIPEPEIYAMLLAGLALLGFMMRGNRNMWKPSPPKRKIAWRSSTQALFT